MLATLKNQGPFQHSTTKPDTWTWLTAFGTECDEHLCIVIASVSSRVDGKAGKKLQGTCQQTREIIEGDFKKGDQQAAAQLCCGVLLMGCGSWVGGSSCCCAFLCSPPPVNLIVSRH